MKALVRIMWVPVLISVLYTGWVFWQRHSAATQPPPARVERDPLAAYGKTLKILQFYTSREARSALVRKCCCATAW